MATFHHASGETQLVTSLRRNPCFTVYTRDTFLCEFSGPVSHTQTHSKVKGHCIHASLLDGCHMKQNVKYHLSVSTVSTCSYLRPYFCSISPNECVVGGRREGEEGDHRTPKTAAAYKECEGPQPREQAGKPYHIWQQRPNLIFINEPSGHEEQLDTQRSVRLSVRLHPDAPLVFALRKHSHSDVSPEDGVSAPST